MGTCWFSLVTAEMISGQYGIGYYTWESYTCRTTRTSSLGMMGIGVLGMGSSVLITLGRPPLMPWYRAARGAA